MKRLQIDVGDTLIVLGGVVMFGYQAYKTVKRVKYNLEKPDQRYIFGGGIILENPHWKGHKKSRRGAKC